MDEKNKLNFLKVKKVYANKKDNCYSIMIYLNDNDCVYLDSKLMKLLFAQADYYENKGGK